MPIIKPTNNTAPVFYPKSDYLIVKYMGLEKFISLLFKKALFFCRLDKLEDKFEGLSNKLTFELYYNAFRVTGKSDKESKEIVEDIMGLEKKLKSATCVCCWNKFEAESAALWKIYSNFSNGIMLKSSISRIENSFKSTFENIEISEIRYLDYNKDIMGIGNTNIPLIHKHRAYIYEDEIRLIFKKQNNEGISYDWSQEEIYNGQNIQCDIEELIEEIVISPNSQNWFFELVKDLSLKYGLNLNISKSQLT